jgi:hypothetical protein
MIFLNKLLAYDLVKELVIKKNFDFQILPNGSQGIQVPFQSWGKHKTMFLTIGFCLNKPQLS